MTKFARTEITEFYAYQFNFEGTELQRDVFEGNNGAAELGYEGALEDVVSASILDVRVSLETASTSNSYSPVGVLTVDLGWIDWDADCNVKKTVTLREGDWLIAEHPRYRVVTNEEFLKLQAVAV